MANVLEVILNLADNFSDGIRDASGAVDTLDDAVKSASDTIDSINPAGLDEVADSASNAADAARDAADGIHETGDAANDTSGSMQGAADSTDILAVGMSALVGLGVAAWFDEITSSADSAAQSMNAMQINFDLDDSGVTNASNSINRLNDETGVAKGTIRDFDNTMGMANVTSVDLANGVIKTAAQLSYLKTGSNDATESISQLFSRAVINGKMMDRSFANNGVSLDEMAARAGMTKDQMKALFEQMTPDERASFLSKYAIDAEDAEKANKGLEDSFDTLKDKFDQKIQKMFMSFGKMVLPLVIPLVDKLTDGIDLLADTLDKAPKPLKDIMGGLILIGGGAALLVPLVTGAKLLLGTFRDVKGAIVGVLEKLGILNKTPCNPKNCTATNSTTGSSTGSTALNILGAVTIAAATVYISYEYMKWQSDTMHETPSQSDSLQSLKSQIGHAISGKGPLGALKGPTEMIMPTAWNILNNPLFKGVNNMNPLDAFGKGGTSWLFPKPAAAAGGGGNKGIMNDLFGKNGALDMSRFGISFDAIPNALNKAFDSVKDIAGSMGKSLSKAWDKIGDTARKLWNDIKKSVTKIVDGLSDGIIKIINGVKNTLQKIWDTIKVTALRIWKTLKDGVNYIVDVLKGHVVSIVDQIKQGVIRGFNAIIGPASAAWNSIKSAVAGPINAIMGWINSLRSALGMSNISPGSMGGAASQGTSSAVHAAGGGRPNISLPSIVSRAAGGLKGKMNPDKIREMFGDLMNYTGNTCNCGPAGAAGGSGLLGAFENAPSYWTGKILDKVNDWGEAIFGPGLDVGSAWNTFLSYAQTLFGRFHYELYFGGKKGPMGVLHDLGGNCVDMTALLNIIANAFGFSAGTGSGTWDGVDHVWSVINGKKMDAVGMVQRGSFFNYPASGPAPSGSNNGERNITLNYLDVDFSDGFNKKKVKAFLDSHIKDPKTVNTFLKLLEKNKGGLKRALG